MNTSPEQQHSLVALQSFAVECTVPVLYDDPAAVDQVGTSTLFTLNGRYFLITAAHIFEDRDPGRFAIPKQRANDNLHTLGPYRLIKAKEPEIDIAVVELLEEKTLSYVKTGWRVVGLNNVAQAPLSGAFMLCGYPSQNAFRTADLIGGLPATVFTHRLLPIPPDAESPVHPALDLFFHYDRDAPTLTKRTAPTPHLGGTSGASVWVYQEPVEAILWAPEKTLKIVGVQSAFKEGSYFRAKSWEMVLQMMRQDDAALSASIDAYYSIKG